MVKVTPAHDFNDYAVGQRHGLPLINIFTPERSRRSTTTRRRSTAASTAIDARKAVLADLEAAGLLVETKPHKLQVPRGDRTGQVIEPYLTDQWFVKMDALAARGLELVENGSVRFVPAELDQHLPPLDGEHPGLVHQPPALVGPSHPGLVRRARQRLRRPRRSRSARDATRSAPTSC